MSDTLTRLHARALGRGALLLPLPQFRFAPDAGEPGEALPFPARTTAGPVGSDAGPMAGPARPPAEAVPTPAGAAHRPEPGTPADGPRMTAPASRAAGADPAPDEPRVTTTPEIGRAAAADPARDGLPIALVPPEVTRGVDADRTDTAPPSAGPDRQVAQPAAEPHRIAVPAPGTAPSIDGNIRPTPAGARRDESRADPPPHRRATAATGSPPAASERPGDGPQAAPAADRSAPGTRRPAEPGRPVDGSPPRGVFAAAIAGERDSPARPQPPGAGPGDAAGPAGVAAEPLATRRPVDSAEPPTIPVERRSAVAAGPLAVAGLGPVRAADPPDRGWSPRAAPPAGRPPEPSREAVAGPMTAAEQRPAEARRRRTAAAEVAPLVPVAAEAPAIPAGPTARPRARAPAGGEAPIRLEIGRIDVALPPSRPPVIRERPQPPPLALKPRRMREP